MKGAFLAVLGVVILIYADKVVEDLRAALEDNFEIAFQWVWDLLKILLWILVAWLFVDAALTIALSFTEHRYSILDVIRRLDRLERRLGPAPGQEAVTHPEAEMVAPVETAEEEAPPPPGE